MIGLDTNVLVRYIMQDDPEQSPKAAELIESLTSESPGYIAMVSAPRARMTCYTYPC